MIYNCVVSLKAITGTASSKTQGTAVTGVRCYLLPASSDVMVMYPELPIGQSFSYLFVNDSISVLPETELKITDAFSSELTVNDTFIVSGVAKKTKVAGQIILSGVCVRKDA